MYLFPLLYITNVMVLGGWRSQGYRRYGSTLQKHLPRTHLVLMSYSLSRKTVNARENFWNVYCFVTSQMRDETAKDNRQTAE